MTQEKLWTVGEVAEHLGQKRARILYVITTRAIAPVHRASGWRLFDEIAVACIKGVLAQIDAQRGR